MAELSIIYDNVTGELRSRLLGGQHIAPDSVLPSVIFSGPIEIGGSGLASSIYSIMRVGSGRFTGWEFYRDSTRRGRLISYNIPSDSMLLEVEAAGGAVVIGAGGITLANIQSGNIGVDPGFYFDGVDVSAHRHAGGAGEASPILSAGMGSGQLGAAHLRAGYGRRSQLYQAQGAGVEPSWADPVVTPSPRENTYNLAALESGRAPLAFTSGGAAWTTLITMSGVSGTLTEFFYGAVPRITSNFTSGLLNEIELGATIGLRRVNISGEVGYYSILGRNFGGTYVALYSGNDTLGAATEIERQIGATIPAQANLDRLPLEIQMLMTIPSSANIQGRVKSVSFVRTIDNPIA